VAAIADRMNALQFLTIRRYLVSCSCTVVLLMGSPHGNDFFSCRSGAQMFLCCCWRRC